MGLQPEEYAPGRIIRHNGDPLIVRDTLVTVSGGRYLVVNDPGDPSGNLLAEQDVRDDQDDRYEAVNDDDARSIREDALAQQEASDTPEPEPEPPTTGGTLPENAPVTDATGGTDGTAQGDPPASPTTTTPAPTEQGGTTPSE